MSIRSFQGRFRHLAAGLALACLVPMTSVACFGTFQLTHKVYDFNRTVSPDKWIRWITFLCMVVIPVYPFSALVDVLFANPTEFWSGHNPITSHADMRSVTGPDGERVEATPIADGVLLTVERQGAPTWKARVVHEGDSVVAYAADGTLLARLHEVDGRPVVQRFAH